MDVLKISISYDRLLRKKARWKWRTQFVRYHVGEQHAIERSRRWIALFIDLLKTSTGRRVVVVFELHGSIHRYVSRRLRPVGVDAELGSGSPQPNDVTGRIVEVVHAWYGFVRCVDDVGTALRFPGLEHWKDVVTLAV